ncbi:subtilisin family serine protease [Nocardioides sp. BE266]|uniref:S8 family peptidase n=1 Tax=Nocardioides sp. BE266 TaxID=2817725 RepID=UPI0028542744|nr:S8/S53 family peptidase [Nocardioides sp. BE266]MDR7253627.1 subtilisin family serine protease [Nocardioides sp. BE266]
MGDWMIGDDRRRRATDQLRHLRRANDGEVAWNTEAPADFTYLFHPNRVLVRRADAEEFEGIVRRVGERLFKGEARRDDVNLLGGALLRYVLPERLNDESVPDVLDQLEEAGLERGKATPDHWVHVSPGGGGGTTCPAVEPQETGLKEPWPPGGPQEETKCRVNVVVVDTGWHPPAATDPRTPWMAGITGDDELNDPAHLRPYAGHGTFIAGVVRRMAPATDIFVEGFCIGGVGGGGILESDMVVQLEEAMKHEPQVINLSAGCRTRMDLPSAAFQTFYEEHLEGKDCVLVAAAGNDSTAAPFWPAAFDWSVGVGSLDRDGRISDYSNYGVSADVYALGRNLVNAFPDGRFECHETPDKGDIRVFNTGMARWSGTSFSAPVVAGLIAREISEHGVSAADARDKVLGRAVYDSDPTVGPHMELQQPFV